jgi:Tfp pilus assembly protein PilW
MKQRPNNRRLCRRGLTLTELLIAGTIMTMLAAGMGSLVLTVQGANAYCRGQSVAAQHARVALDRIHRAVRTAEASEQFPGCIVVSETVGAWDFPDALVVWSPTAAAAAPSGLPQVNELVIFTPDPLAPSRLLELRAPSNTATVPAVSNTAAWATLVDSLRSSTDSAKTEISDRLRTSPVTTGSTDLRGAVRFQVLLAPSAEYWAEYRASTRAWKDLNWPLDYVSTQTGLRRVVCQTELQILADGEDAAQTSVPYFGSAALNYELAR